MPIFFDEDRILVSNHKTDIEFAKKHGMKEMDTNKEDASLEKITLEGIIGEKVMPMIERELNMENGALKKYVP